MIDTNVSLFRWPFRRLAGDEPAELVAGLRNKGVTQAWAGSFEGLFSRETGTVNARLADACSRYGPNFLVPFGSINPKLPDWKEDLRRCQEQYRMPGIRLHPNYHEYTLEDPAAAEVLSLAADRGLLVQIALEMEDTRQQNPLARAPAVDARPLAGLVQRISKLRLLVLNAISMAQVRGLAHAKNVWFDIARLEEAGAVARLVAATSPSRVVFGSHYPFYYFESAVLKVREAGLPEDQAGGVLEANARTLLGTEPHA